jgi:hypothetical protein
MTGRTYITGRFGLAMSFPLKPARIKTGPSHLIILKVTANAIPLNAMDDTKGAPSPSNVLTSTPRQAPARNKRLQVSRWEREFDAAIAILYRSCRPHPTPSFLTISREVVETQLLQSGFNEVYAKIRKIHTRSLRCQWILPVDTSNVKAV